MQLATLDAYPRVGPDTDTDQIITDYARVLLAELEQLTGRQVVRGGANAAILLWRASMNIAGRELSPAVEAAAMGHTVELESLENDCWVCIHCGLRAMTPYCQDHGLATIVDCLPAVQAIPGPINEIAGA